MLNNSNFRIYVVKNGKAYQTRIVTNRSVNAPAFSYEPITNKRGANISFVKNKGGVVLSQKQFSNLINLIKNYSIMNKDFVQRNQQRVNGIDKAVTTTGGVRTIQNVTRGNGSAGRELLTITLANNGSTPQTTVLFDGTSLISQKKNLPTLSSSVAVGGTFGVLTLANMRVLGGQVALVIEGLHITSNGLSGEENALVRTPNETFFNSGQISTAVASPTNNSLNEKIIPLSDITDGGTFNRSVRKDSGFAFYVNPLSGLPVTIPAKTEVTISFAVSLVEGSTQMIPVG